jgi:integrase
MAIVRRKGRTGKVVYWVKFRWLGKDVWERSGTNERNAIALDNRRKREVANGTYQRTRTGRTSAGAWLTEWIDKRTNRTVENDRALLKHHVLPVAWFTELEVGELSKTKHILRLVEDIRRAGRLGEKSIATVVGIVMQAIRSACVAELVSAAPVIPRGTLKRKTAAANKRKPYQREDAKRLITCADIPPDQRMFAALAFYTGMREGEVCGRRWRDWDVKAKPLTALLVHSQYDDQPLKGDDDETTRPRRVPVHPELANLLRDWWLTGFELVYCRKPTLADFVVPQRTDGNHTKSSGYKLFQRALRTAGVPNLSLHSTRHAFISIARSNGAAKDVLERVTHNASGETIDDYTTFEWRSLCDAVSKFSVDSPVDPEGNGAFLQLQSLDSNQRATTRLLRETTGNGENQEATDAPQKRRGSAGIAARSDAHHQSLTPAHLAVLMASVQRRADLRALARAGASS